MWVCFIIQADWLNLSQGAALNKSPSDLSSGLVGNKVKSNITEKTLICTRVVSVFPVRLGSSEATGTCMQLMHGRPLFYPFIG